MLLQHMFINQQGSMSHDEGEASSKSLNGRSFRNFETSISIKSQIFSYVKG